MASSSGIPGPNQAGLRTAPAAPESSAGRGRPVPGGDLGLLDQRLHYRHDGHHAISNTLGRLATDRVDRIHLDAVPPRHPDIALVDELAHTNVPGSRNEKRWQDVEELLAAGISVISTVNVQHLESLNDVVAGNASDGAGSSKSRDWSGRLAAFFANSAVAMDATLN